MSQSETRAMSSIEQLQHAAEMAGHANACEYSCAADYLTPDAIMARSRHRMAFSPWFTACLALMLFLF